MGVWLKPMERTLEAQTAETSDSRRMGGRSDPLFSKAAKTFEEVVYRKRQPFLIALRRISFEPAHTTQVVFAPHGRHRLFCHLRTGARPEQHDAGHS